MFSEMITELGNKGSLEPDALRKRFDFAMTKKIGTLKLPPAFWTHDPKINPRSDHLFWVSLLLIDRQRIDMALSVLEMELTEKTSLKEEERAAKVASMAKGLVQELLAQFADQEKRRQFAKDLQAVAPEWFPSADRNDDE